MNKNNAQSDHNGYFGHNNKIKEDLTIIIAFFNYKNNRGSEMQIGDEYLILS